MLQLPSLCNSKYGSIFQVITFSSFGNGTNFHRICPFPLFTYPSIGTYMQLLDAVSRIATLGVETSYRQTVALMIRGYYSQISTGGSVERKTSAPKSRTEYVEVYFSLIHCSFSEFFFPITLMLTYPIAIARLLLQAFLQLLVVL